MNTNDEWDELALSPVPIDPSPELKDSIFAAIEDEPQVANIRRNRFKPAMFAVAAVFVLLAGSLTIPRLLVDDPPAQVQAMHDIMESTDAESGNMNVEGVELQVVSSDAMNKAGAMVQGAPKVQEGMGVQVWSVSNNGDMHSAGVIGPEEHKNVWMPFDAATTRVILTEEPLAGSEKPTGTMLGELHL